MGLDIAHVTFDTFDGAGSWAAIASTSVQVSFDGGQTWQNTVLHGSKGHYRVRWTNPDSARGTQPRDPRHRHRHRHRHRWQRAHQDHHARLHRRGQHVMTTPRPDQEIQ
ncbi:hypothetical protein [Streptomyces camelliae]|uniref:Moybdenum cofactor oxidoreductase dimerisation domain-containing protein n=1 Tax=Streptomyces camelliae TaxID=3004093 RepID=A0ABY7NWA0_9ACTN|nr:hypothetical protein [Streptomyces sp. HUAS 2-6]WBO61519.1 hypothetical protein O1G22_00835 [Streptomyces sp. HUAS 2-6]